MNGNLSMERVGLYFRLGRLPRMVMIGHRRRGTVFEISKVG